MGSKDRLVEVLIWREHLALLKKHDFPGSEKILATATQIDSGGEGDVLLTGSRVDFESLAGWVASEANYHARQPRSSRKAATWSEISERIECAL